MIYAKVSEVYLSDDSVGILPLLALLGGGGGEAPINPVIITQTQPPPNNAPPVVETLSEHLGIEVGVSNWTEDVSNHFSDSDVFVYNNILNGHDKIINFEMDYDVLDLASLLSYNQGDVITDFISLIDNAVDTTLYIDANGDGSGTDVSIVLRGHTGLDINTMIDDGNIMF